MEKTTIYESPEARLLGVALPGVLCESGGAAGTFDEETFDLIS